VVKDFARRIISGENLDSSLLEVNGLGSMSIQEVDSSWVNRLLAGGSGLLRP
jgi:hypothetical protein